MRPSDDHWLARPETVRRLKIAGCVVLALTVVAEVWIPIDGDHGIDEFLGFPAVFGFASCVAMVLVAKALGLVLKRDEDHYDE